MGNFDNYSPRKIHPSGRKELPYDITVQGVIYANGDRKLPPAESDQPAPGAVPLSTANCCGASLGASAPVVGPR